MYLPVLFVLIIMSCSNNVNQKSIEANQRIVIGNIQTMPEDIEGCACYLSKKATTYRITLLLCR